MHQETAAQANVRTASTSSPAANRRSHPGRGMAAMVKEAIGSRLFLLTTIAAMDGQLMALAAGGHLAQPVVVLTVAFTMIAGVGAFLAALEEARLGQPRGRATFLVTAALSILVNVAAAGAGLALATVVQLDTIRYFAALALAIIAWEVLQDDAVHLAKVPAPMAVMVTGLAFEVLV